MEAFTLKDDMLLGVCLPATQCEGGELESNWIYWWGLGYVRDHASPAVAAQHTEHWQEDIALAKSLGAQTVRLGVDWTRVEPEEGVFDEAATEYYRAQLLALRDAGLRAALELHRFTNPVWFEERGGFEREENLSAYLAYIEHVAAALGDLCQDYLTFAEPNAYAVGGYLGGDYPPGRNNPSACFRVLTHMAQCHVLAYSLLHQLHEAMEYPPCRVSVSLRAQELLPIGGGRFAGVLCSAAKRAFDAAFRAFYLGRIELPMKYNRYLVPGMYCDFLALDWYGGQRVGEALDLTPFAKRGELGRPEALLGLAKRLHALAPLPLHVSLAGVDDGERVDCLAAYLHALAGFSLPVESCCVSPLLDGFEWLDGNRRRTGLVRVDFETQQRTIKASGEFFRCLAASRGVDQELLRQYGAV
ncbi:MAG: glycoside hydrolase family 1 protein [Oscillospiraceae bacterium]|nr:glycoside hydrolase family 1 protein [Oscillospiraceae bacterium]